MTALNIRTDASDLVDIVSRQEGIVLDDLAKEMKMTKEGLFRLVKLLERGKLLKSKRLMNGNITVSKGEKFKEIESDSGEDEIIEESEEVFVEPSMDNGGTLKSLPDISIDRNFFWKAGEGPNNSSMEHEAMKATMREMHSLRKNQMDPGSVKKSIAPQVAQSTAYGDNSKSSDSSHADAKEIFRNNRRRGILSIMKKNGRKHVESDRMAETRKRPKVVTSRISELKEKENVLSIKEKQLDTQKKMLYELKSRLEGELSKYREKESVIKKRERALDKRENEIDRKFTNLGQKQKDLGMLVEKLTV